MKKLVSSTLACVILGSSVLVGATPSLADRGGDRERYVSRYCAEHSRDRDCRDFRRGHGNWDEARYKRWYRDRHDRNDNGAAALFGFAAGAIAGAAAGAAANTSNGHVAACEARYRSYDRRTDTYLNYDGNRYRCTL